MKFYIQSPDHQKVYIRGNAVDRRELAKNIGSKSITVDGRRYSVNDVKAEKGDNNAGLGLFLGGAVGLLAGPPGIVAGSLLGVLIGKDQDDKEGVQVESFNKSRA